MYATKICEAVLHIMIEVLSELGIESFFEPVLATLPQAYERKHMKLFDHHVRLYKPQEL